MDICFKSGLQDNLANTAHRSPPVATRSVQPNNTPAENNAAPPMEIHKPIVESGRILVMDDEESVRHVTKLMLEKVGYQAVTARNGRDAYALYRAAMTSGLPFDAVILDLTVPGDLGGKETIDILRKYDPSVKALLSSGYSADDILPNFHELGFSAAITKPFPLADLVAILKKITTKTQSNDTVTADPSSREA